MSADWYSNGDIAVALVPRVASSSIRDAVRTLYMQVSPEDALKVDRRIAWVRDPIERLVSAYSIFHHSHLGLPASITGNWDTFVDYTLQTIDYHWEPQSNLLSLDGEIIPNELYHLRDLQKTWPFDGLLPWLRGVRHVDVDLSYRRDELDEKYRQDFELCRSVLI